MVPTLCDLPVELFDAIVDELPEFYIDLFFGVHDLKQLRLVCRTMQVKTRARFGREFVSGLRYVVSPSSSDPPNRIAEDEIFRNCVLAVYVHMENDKSRAYQPTDWDGLRAKFQNGVNKSDMRRNLEHTPRLESLILESPIIPSDATDADRSLIPQVWHMMVRDFLSILFAMPELPLKLIRIGNINFNYAVTPVYLFSGIPMDSASLSQLETFELRGTGGENCLSPPPSKVCDTSTQTLGDFLALLPKLRSFDYSWMNVDHCPLHRISGNPPVLPFLHRLSLCLIALTSTELLKDLRIAGEALKFLSLSNIKLTNGEWRPILDYIRERQSSHLKALFLNRLQQGDKQWVFDKILKDRAIVIDSDGSENSSMSWRAVIIGASASGQYDATSQALEKEVAALIADEWIWVDQHPNNTKYIDIDSAEGDDVNIWLDRVINDYELKEL